LPLYNRGEAQRIQEPSAQQAAGREDHFVHKVKALLFLPFRDEAQVYQGSRSKRIMAHKKSFGLPLVLILLFCLGALCPTGAKAQASTSNATSRLAGDWRSSALVTLTAAKPLMPQTTADLGTAAPATRLERMLLLLHPSAAQQQALLTELANQQNPVSTEYHHWLTPAAYADSYANSSSDVAAVSAWLTSQGFKAAALPAGRGWIEFSGTVAQVEQAFQAQIDLAATASGTRLVLAGTISVPAALKPLVHGLVSLDGAFSATALTTPQTMTSTAAELAAETSLSKAEALTPQLAAQLLHLDTLHASGTNGAGQTIAIATRSNVRSEDVAAFRTAFGLPASALLVTPNGTDPGLADDQAEAVLSASWAGAGAPGARILLVPAGSTSATDGLDLSLAAIVDQALAHTVAVGYSTCEGALGEAHQAFYAALYQQAAAEGIAVIAASGDRRRQRYAGQQWLQRERPGFDAVEYRSWRGGLWLSWTCSGSFGPGGMVAGQHGGSSLCGRWRRQHALRCSQLATPAGEGCIVHQRQQPGRYNQFCLRPAPFARRGPAYGLGFRREPRPGLLPQQFHRLLRLHSGARRRQFRSGFLVCGCGGFGSREERRARQPGAHPLYVEPDQRHLQRCAARQRATALRGVQSWL
jgi:hypothetical protein